MEDLEDEDGPPFEDDLIEDDRLPTEAVGQDSLTMISSSTATTTARPSPSIDPRRVSSGLVPDEDAPTLTGCTDPVTCPQGGIAGAAASSLHLIVRHMALPSLRHRSSRPRVHQPLYPDHASSSSTSTAYTNESGWSFENPLPRASYLGPLRPITGGTTTTGTGISLSHPFTSAGVSEGGARLRLRDFDHRLHSSGNNKG